ncbi:MAG TPA: alpha-L-fucosidase [Ruminiclostridium sp.]
MKKQKSQAYIDRLERTKWFRNERFGMFIHWGLYSIPARGEWVRSTEKISIEDYQQYFDEFNPSDCDMREWAKLAKASGVKYAVLTAKHHDGFCLFDSKFTEYKSTKTLAGRDFIREFVDAFRAEGIKVGIYYSLVDWYHPDYPAYGDRQHPMRDNIEYKDKNHNFDNYLTYMHEQVRELCTNYGIIDILWFDFSYWKMKGDVWKASELTKMIRSLQPNVVINNRLGGNIEASEPEIYAGDYHGPEQIIPDAMLVDEEGDPIAWEACITLNRSWGYCSTDKDFKSSAFVIQTLANCVSKNGNLLINIGPNAKGIIPPQSAKMLLEVGQWLKDNGKSIYECGPAPIEKQEWGRFTWDGKKLYAHIDKPVLGQIYFKGMKNKIKKARLLSDGSEIILSEYWNQDNGVDKYGTAEDVFVNFGHPVANSFDLPDAKGTVIEFELK